jgi:copper chaperone
MISFRLDDMSCGHCVDTITKALKAVDPAATLRFDLAAHRVDIESGTADAAVWSQAISQAGYTPVRLECPRAASGAAVAPARRGCCCG